MTHPHPLIRSSQVRDMLGHKVSRERIGTELDGMIKGPDPLMALDLLRTMGLFEAVFEVYPPVSHNPSSFEVVGVKQPGEPEVPKESAQRNGPPSSRPSRRQSRTTAR